MSKSILKSHDFYTLQVAPGGGFGVRGWKDKTIVSIHTSQREAHAAAKRLNLEGHATASVDLPEPLLQAAAIRAEIDGLSMTDWIASIVDDRLRMDELNDRFHQRIADGASAKAIREILDLAPDVPPMPGDELEA
jgi:DNA-binding GntR family transcriptional regulator